MVQKTYEVRLESEQDFLVAWKQTLVILEKIRENPLYKESNSIYIKLLFANVTVERAEKASKKIREALPKAIIAGMSLTLFGQENQDQQVLRLSCFFFRASHVTLLEYSETPECYHTFGRMMGGKISAMEDVKGVEILCTGDVSVNVAKFIDGVSEGNEEIPFFGAEAGVFEIEGLHQEQYNIFKFSDRKKSQFVIGEKFYRRGLVMVVFSGKELHLRADYILGWKPLGRELKVTEVVNSTCIARIDDMPAAEIYHRYLKVRTDDKFMFNICEFPLMVERNGCLLARVPPCYDDEMRLYFNGDIQEGEKLRLSYGNPQEILQETWHASEEMHFFMPEALWLCACGNRAFFLKEHAHVEIDDYLRIVPDLVLSNGQAEIYRYKGQGGLLNTALIAVGMREGEPKTIPLAVNTCDCPFHHSSQIIPLSTRLATFLDVTAKDLKAMAAEAKKASVAKSRFLSSMSHEIRTPINAILGMDEMILRECKDPAILEYAENIRVASNSLLGLVNDILDFSKIEAGKLDIIPVEYALSSLLNDLVNMIQSRAEKKGLKLIVQVPEDIPSILYGDEIRLKQIITNILTNAVKYTETGTVTLSVDYERQEEDGLILHVSVKDTGIGIKEEDIAKLFNAFERIEEKRNRAIEGTGLGMNITQRLLGLMGSQLEVESVYGKGSEFSFSVAQKIMNAEPMGNFQDSYRRMLAKRKEYKESFTAPEAVILVVDDTVMNITVVKGLLKQTKVQIDTAENGYECLHMVTQKHYDIIFLDHRMPGLDGIETLERMKELPENLNRDTPVISLTANAVSGARTMYIEAGFQDYLTKPIHSAKLESLMMKYLPAEKVILGAADSEPPPEEDEETTALPAWLTEVDGLDTKQGVLYCGTAENYMGALTVFSEAILPGADEIQKYFETRDWKSYTVKVHALKSTARIIGAKELSERAKRLEEAGNGGYLEDIALNTPALLSLYRSYAEKLAPLTGPKGKDEDKPPIDDEELKDAFETLKEVSSTFDYDSLKFVLESLEEYRLPEGAAKTCKALREAAREPDWERVKELLESAENR